MNIKSLTLSIISVAAAAAASLPAQAQEEMNQQRRPSARWEYAPNTWKKETAIMPHGYYSAPTANVRSGSVPKSNMLGLDPSYLAKAPPRPTVAPLVIARQAVSAVPIIAAKPKNIIEAFSASFGKPISTAPVPMVASLPQSLPAQPMAATPTAGKSVAARRIHVPTRRVGTGLSGKLLTPQHPVAAVANYGSMGFQPGAFTPTAGSGMSTNTSVNARLLRH